MFKETVTKKEIINLAKRIKKRRCSLGLSVVQLAEKAGVSHHSLYNLELGIRCPRAITLWKIANALEVSMDFLLGTAEESELTNILQNEKIKSFFDTIQNLSAEDREFIMRQADMMEKIKKIY